MIGVIPRKRFGQHFLTDDAVLEDIIATFSPKPDERVLEIGPGTGALTKRLLNHLHHLVAIEIDRDMVKLLKAQFSEHPLSILQQDILKTDIHSPDVLGNSNKLRIIGNLPYNISTPLLFHLFESLDIIQDMLFMVQKEVALRLVARPNNRHYGRLSATTWLKVNCELLFDIAPNSFNPPPKVQSSMVHLHPRKPIIELKSQQRFEMLVKTAFSQRRKTLRNSLSNMLSPDQFKEAGIDDSKRPENLHPRDFIALSNIDAEN